MKISPTAFKHKLKFNSIVSLQSSPVSFSDPFVLQLAETLEDSLPSSSSFPLQKLRESSSENLLSTPWPSRKDEPFRFTDISLIKQSPIHPISLPPHSSHLSSIPLDTQFPNIVIVDGHVINSLSNLKDLPNGVFVGSLIDLNSESVVLKRVSELFDGNFVGDLFWSINGVGAPDLTVVYVPEGCKVENPVNLRYFSIQGGDEESKFLPVSNPRVLVLVENEREIDIIEEFLSRDGSLCFGINTVLEVMIGNGGKVRHSYIQNQSLDAAHIKWTFVQQESTSTYELTEISTGGKLSRHNVHIQQLGPETTTELSTSHLSVSIQTQDLHSKLVLDHPRGYARQLHKCIVSNSQGQAVSVFYGNVKVNRYAQQTDAGQLTRTLLLEPRATANLKSNLQIIADDVKCSHGASISDLEETQLFYFQAREIDLETARKALIFSFGAQVIERLPYASLCKKVENQIKESLNLTID